MIEGCMYGWVLFGEADAGVRGTDARFCNTIRVSAGRWSRWWWWAMSISVMEVGVVLDCRVYREGSIFNVDWRTGVLLRKYSSPSYRTHAYTRIYIFIYYYRWRGSTMTERTNGRDTFARLVWGPSADGRFKFTFHYASRSSESSLKIFLTDLFLEYSKKKRKRKNPSSFA